MKILLSGAQYSQSPQQDPQQSLGGFMSSTPLPNGQINALFTDVSSYSKKNKTQDTYGLFLHNDSEASMVEPTIQQIYEELLGKNTNQANFEWGVVEPTDDFQMEVIGSSKETPYGATFFTPTTKRESCVLKIITAPQPLEEFTLLGETIVFGEGGVKETVEQIVSYFENVPKYDVEVYSDNQIYIKNTTIEDTKSEVKINSAGTVESDVVNFKGFVDGATIIADEILPGKALGLWVRRTVKPSSALSNCEIEKEDTDQKECLEVLFSF